MTVKIESLPDTIVLKSEVIEAIIKSLGITKAAFFIRENISQKTDYLVKLINRMKKLLLKMSEYKLVFISVAFLVILSFGCAKKDGKEIKIGAILPLTGS